MTKDNGMVQDLRLQSIACLSAAHTFNETHYEIMQEHSEWFSEAADEIERLRSVLLELETLGKEGMKPSYTEWLSFHDKVAQIAHCALEPSSESR